MENVIAGVFDAVLSKKVKANSKADTDTDLLEQIETVSQRLESVASHFENQSDPDLIEASIYETKSLSARYRYLLRQAREKGITKSLNNILQHEQHY